MGKLSAHEIATLLLGLAILLGFARAFGELFNKLRQPAIAGELLAGVLLGPTVLGAAFPELFSFVFPVQGPIAVGYQVIVTLALVLLLLVAGLEIDLSIVWRQGKEALSISLFGVVVPFGLAFVLAWLAPHFWGMSPGADALTFSLFIGIALSISALPVIARIMLDLDLFKTDVGMLVMAAAMVSDLVGWLGFAIILGAIGASSGHAGLPAWGTIGLTLGIFVLTLTIGRHFVDRALPWVQERLSWPGGVLGFMLVLTLLGAAATEAIGVHAVFGAFLVGIVVGDSPHLREHTRTVLHHFVMYIFAPIFLVTIGLQANFLEHFNLLLVLAVLAVAFTGKIGGCLLGGWLGGIRLRDNLAVAFGMNARGTMEIILAVLALEAGIIQEDVFVALVLLAVLSSVIAAPLMQRFVGRADTWNLADLIRVDRFLPDLHAATREEAILKLSRIAAESTGLDVGRVAEAVLTRERLMGSSLGHEIAVPHAPLDDLDKPVLVIGHCDAGVDFNSPDGVPTHFIFLLLTARKQASMEAQLIAQIARAFRDPAGRRLVAESDSVDAIRELAKQSLANDRATRELAGSLA